MTSRSEMKRRELIEGKPIDEGLNPSFVVIDETIPSFIVHLKPTEVVVERELIQHITGLLSFHMPTTAEKFVLIQRLKDASNATKPDAVK